MSSACRVKYQLEMYYRSDLPNKRHLFVSAGSSFVYKPGIFSAQRWVTGGQHMVYRFSIKHAFKIVQIAVVQVSKKLHGIWPVIKICLVYCLHTTPVSKTADSCLHWSPSRPYVLVVRWRPTEGPHRHSDRSQAAVRPLGADLRS